MTEFEDYDGEYDYEQFKQGMDSQMAHMKRYQAEQANKAGADEQTAIFQAA